MEEQWYVVYVDRISDGELTSRISTAGKRLCSMRASSTATVTRFCG